MKAHPTLIKWLKVLAKVAVVALLAWMIRGTLVSAFTELNRPEHDFELHWPWLILTGVAYLLGSVPNALFWSQVIAATDHPVGVYPPVRSFYVSAIGKYVPGKAMVLVLRAATMRPFHVPPTLVTVGVFYETLTNMAVGSLVSLTILLCLPDKDPMLIFAALGMAAVTGLPILPPIFKLALRYSGLKRLDARAVEKLHLIGPRLVVVGWLTLVVGWWIQGLSLWATLRAMGAPHSDLSRWPTFTAVIALSVVAGFLALLPAGVGARELVTMKLLSPICGPTPAVVSAILLRLVSVVADVGISSILYFIRPSGVQAGDELPGEPATAAAIDEH